MQGGKLEGSSSPTGDPGLLPGLGCSLIRVNIEARWRDWLGGGGRHNPRKVASLSLRGLRGRGGRAINKVATPASIKNTNSSDTC